MLGVPKFFEKNVRGVKILEWHKIGHENFCAFSEISSVRVCAIINDRSLIYGGLCAPEKENNRKGEAEN